MGEIDNNDRGIPGGFNLLAVSLILSFLTSAVFFTQFPGHDYHQIFFWGIFVSLGIVNPLLAMEMHRVIQLNKFRRWRLEDRNAYLEKRNSELIEKLHSDLRIIEKQNATIREMRVAKRIHEGLGDKCGNQGLVDDKARARTNIFSKLSSEEKESIIKLMPNLITSYDTPGTVIAKGLAIMLALNFKKKGASKSKEGSPSATEVTP